MMEARRALQAAVGTAVVFLAATAPWVCSAAAAVGDDGSEGVVAKAALDVAEVWDAAARKLPERAVAGKLPEPTLAEVTLSKAMGHSDMRLQMVAWNNRFLFGRAWVEGHDRIPRAVWVLNEKPVEGGVSLRMMVGVLGASGGDGRAVEGCPFEVKLGETAGRISGRYVTPGVDVYPLPIPAAAGAALGTRRPLTGAAWSSPALCSSGKIAPAEVLSEAVKDLTAAADMMRLYRALGIVLTQNVAPVRAWDAGRLMIPAFPPEKKVAAAKARGKPPRAPTLDVDLGIEDTVDIGSGPAADAGGKARAPDPAVNSKLATMVGVLDRMRASAAAWAEALPSFRAEAPCAEEAAADPDFGPWYGHGCLATNATQANVLPADAEAEGSQRWLFVRNWQFVGPFPSNEAALASPDLVEFLDVTNALHLTDTEGLKRNNETFIPETPLVLWQSVAGQVEQGLQRPPVWRGVTADADVCDKVDAATTAGPWNGYSYARTEVFSPKDVELWVGLSADEHGRVWVNDRLAAATGGSADEPERVAWGKAAFRKGMNVLVVRCDNITNYGFQRDSERSTWLNHFWVKIAVRGKPLDAAAAAARLNAVAGRRSGIRHVAPGVHGYRNNNTANYPDAKPVTAWDVCTGQNVIWRAHLECEPVGRQYEMRGPNSKAPPVVLGDRIVVLGEPHFVICLDKATGKKLWETECNVLEFTAPDKLAEARRIWSEHVAARNRLFELDRDWDTRRAMLKKQGRRIHPPAGFNAWAEWVEVLAERGMAEQEAGDEIARRIAAMNAKSFDVKRRKGEYEKLMMEHGQYAPCGWGNWTGYSFGSPVTDGEKVWVKFCTGVAACLDRDGNRLWMSRIPADFNQYAVCSSPLLTDGRFIVEVGAAGTHLKYGYDSTMLVALDAATGRELWRSEKLFQRGATSSSIAMTATNGREEMPVVATGGGAVVRVSDGKTMSQLWMVDSGQGTPTVNGPDVYYSSDYKALAACRLVMYDRDTVGLRRLWTRPMPTHFDGGLVYDKGLLYGPGGGQRPGGYVVFDAEARSLLRHEFVASVRQGIAPYVNGRQYVPAIAAGDYLFLGEHGSLFDGPAHDGAVCAVMQKGADGMILAQNEVEETWTAPPVFEGDRIYIRTDPSLICVGYTGDDGRAYEADVNARYLLPELEVMPPRDTPPVEIPPTRAVVAWPPVEFARFISHSMSFVGPFAIANADAVLTALGGIAKVSEGVCKEPQSPGAPGVRFPVEVAGEEIKGGYKWPGIEANAAKCLQGQTNKAAFFQNAFKNDRERVVRVWAMHEPPDIWICGQPVAEGVRVRLKPGVYSLVALVHNTEAMPAALGFHFRFDDSSDVAAERQAWQESLRRAKPVLERIARHGTNAAWAGKARQILAALEDR